uniref:RNA polymerase sigma factor n=1 Tax=Thermosporothrix sp. COM3 TaxID=2490863 RepID=A0A455SMU4_9CHLR|nr:hypothetical protein KTC_37970 [Thermosporothrix sp. COM3]
MLRQTRAFGIIDEQAEDVVQETLIAAWKGLHQLRDPERFEAWLSGICRNLCLQYVRRQKANSSTIYLGPLLRKRALILRRIFFNRTGSAC